MYKAKIIRAKVIEPIPDSDNIVLLKYNGYQFVIGKDISVGDLVCLFPTDGQLSEAFCRENNLFRHGNLNKDPLKTGFFEDNRRIRAQIFRKVKSEGFVCGLDSFKYLGKVEFTEDMEFDSLNGKLICEKYYTPQTIKAMQNTKAHEKKIKNVVFNLREHLDTQQLAYNYGRLINTGVFIFTEKLHGTSARTGNVIVETYSPNFFQKILDPILRKRTGKFKREYQLVSGTRHTIINNRVDITEPGGADHYRWEWHNFFKEKLHKGETIYYEIVGYDSHGGTIMNSHDLKDLKKKYKDLAQFPDHMVFSYGLLSGNDIYVYRITQETGEVCLDLSWEQLKSRCKELGVKYVPELGMYCCIDPSVPNIEILREDIIPLFLNNSCSILDKNHIREGIVLRQECEKGFLFLKDKNFLFKILEGILKDDSSYVDTEEIN